MTAKLQPKNSASITFSMGLPAAGKSTYINTNYDLNKFQVIDPDAIKEAHPDYDPKNPAALHAWSQEETEKLWNAALLAGTGNYIVDGTGTNAEKMVRRINEARNAGYSIELIYVTCSLETSLARNAARARNVPEHIIKEKAQNIETAFELIAPYADNVEIIDNN